MNTSPSVEIEQHVVPLLRRAVDQFADRDALVFRDRCWTFRELGRLAAAAAAQLSDVCSPGSRIAIVGQNHPAFVFGYLGAQLRGASTIEAGRDESLQTLLGILDLSKPAVVLTDRADLEAALAGKVPVHSFEAFEAACLETASRHSLDETNAPTLDPEDELSVVFTSGTTGLPKGVRLNHRNVMFVVNAVRTYLELTPSDRYALVLPLCHTYGKSNLLSSLSSGAATVIVEGFPDLVKFFDQLSRHRCTVLSVVPFHLNLFARRGMPADIDWSPRAITTSGGPLSWDTVAGLNRLWPAAQIVPMYGLTESSTRLCYLPPSFVPRKKGSVGRALPGVVIEIRAENGTALPTGASGEIVARGPNIMMGYLSDPELTARTIRDGWLYTGDIGRLDEDGCLFIEGRQKEIIKVAGERISPSEIEDVLASHDEIADAAVIGSPDAMYGEVVWAYIVTPTGNVPDDLGRYCSARLSPHKLPKRVILVDRIPRTPTGKIRRHLLKDK
jgi:acyl-CoA synthetase (AMP-forming)/AMP-acid ligase II